MRMKLFYEGEGGWFHRLLPLLSNLLSGHNSKALGSFAPVLMHQESVSYPG